MFSVSLFTEESSTVQGHDPKTPLKKGTWQWPPLYRALPQVPIPCTGPWPDPPLPDMFKFVHYEACTVSKRALGILLELPFGKQVRRLTQHLKCPCFQKRGFLWHGDLLRMVSLRTYL